MSLRLCLVSSEVAPFAKTGGLADAVAGLARWLASEGHDVRIFMPHYRQVARAGIATVPAEDVGDVSFEVGGRREELSCRFAFLPQSEAKVYFIDSPGMFGRESIYSLEHHDEHARFALLSRAVIEVCQRLRWGPDVFHCNDWHAALLPLYLRTLYAWDALFHRSRTLLTIHNIDFQGVFAAKELGDLGLEGEARLLDQADLHERGVVNTLKTGLLHTDAISTVSATYATEIRSVAGGRGLEGLLEQRSDVLTGIVNGVDYGTWDPARDPMIPARYTAGDLRGKEACKRALLERFHLRPDEDCLVLGVVSRLTAQKGFDLLPEVMPSVLEDPRVRLVALGSGERHYEDWFQELRDRVPDRVAFHRGYHEELAHWIEAGADAFLMPSQAEPCGLNQMYSLRYGTPPIVRRTGGLADTVVPWDGANGTGFVFGPFEPPALLQALGHVRAAFGDAHQWGRLVANGMATDFSWARQGPHYVALYERMLR